MNYITRVILRNQRSNWNTIFDIENEFCFPYGLIVNKKALYLAQHLVDDFEFILVNENSIIQIVHVRFDVEFGRIKKQKQLDFYCYFFFAWRCHVAAKIGADNKGCFKR